MKQRQGWQAALFLLPYATLFLVFVLGPLLYGFWISLHNWHILSKDVPFVGMNNYARAIGDDLFLHSLVRTGYFVLLAVPLGNVISLLMAIGLNQKYRGTTFYSICFYLPVVLSISVTAIRADRHTERGETSGLPPYGVTVMQPSE